MDWSQVLSGAASSVIGGIFGASGAKQQQQFSAQQAAIQRQWQQRMSSTAYQRAAKDLEAAGLNRILALGSPASTPGGAMAQGQNVGQAAMDGANSAMALKVAKQELKNMAQAEKRDKAQAEHLSEQAETERFAQRNLQQQTLNLNTSGAMLINDWEKQNWVMDTYRKNPNWIKTEVGLQGGNARQIANIAEYLAKKWGINK